MRFQMVLRDEIEDRKRPRRTREGSSVRIIVCDELKKNQPEETEEKNRFCSILVEILFLPDRFPFVSPLS